MVNDATTSLEPLEMSIHDEKLIKVPLNVTAPNNHAMKNWLEKWCATKLTL
jgi:hypothetical protein